MTKKEIKKALNDKNSVITCIRDYDLECERYTRNGKIPYILNEIQKENLKNLFEQFSNNFFVVGDTFKDDERTYKIS